MLTPLRAELLRKLGEIHEIISATKIEESELRRFANGIASLEVPSIEALAKYLRLEIRKIRSGPTLPFEGLKCDEIAQDIEAELSRASEFFSLGLRIIGYNSDGPSQLKPKSKSTKFSGLIIAVCMALITKIFRQYRSIISLSELGVSQEADVILRALFESMLALKFILESSVQLKENGVLLENVKINGQLIKLKKATTLVRAKMYVAQFEISMLDKIEKFIKAGKADTAKAFGDQKLFQKQVKFHQRSLGAGWVHRIKKLKSYCGMSVSDLATSYGLDLYYDTFYHFQSKSIHGSNAISYLSINEETQSFEYHLSPTDLNIRQTLFYASAMFLEALKVVNKSWKLGFTKDINAISKSNVNPD